MKEHVPCLHCRNKPAIVPSMKSPSITRREAITALALGTAAVSAPFSACSNLSPSAGNGPRNPAFRYCLNTSTISGRESGLLQYINIAATAGLTGERSLDLFEAGEKYGSLLEPGRKTGVMPQLEFWGSSPVLWHLGQALMVASAASDADVNILPDIYHLFRGGSGFESLKMLNGTLVGIEAPRSKLRGIFDP